MPDIAVRPAGRRHELTVLTYLFATTEQVFKNALTGTSSLPRRRREIGADQCAQAFTWEEAREDRTSTPRARPTPRFASSASFVCSLSCRLVEVADGASPQAFMKELSRHIGTPVRAV